jgi:hypothetical protein
MSSSLPPISSDSFPGQIVFNYCLTSDISNSFWYIYTHAFKIFNIIIIYGDLLVNIGVNINVNIDIPREV